MEIKKLIKDGLKINRPFKKLINNDMWEYSYINVGETIDGFYEEISDEDADLLERNSNYVGETYDWEVE